MPQPAPSRDGRPTGRRDHSRVRLDLPGDFVLLDGLRKCRIRNLSVTGASVEIEPTPRLHANGFLRFAGQEMFVRVIWSNAGRCGVEFDCPVPCDLLLTMRDLSQHIPTMERARQEQAIRDWVNGRGRIVSGHA
jgi:PilZ domain